MGQALSTTALIADLRENYSALSGLRSVRVIGSSAAFQVIDLSGWRRGTL